MKSEIDVEEHEEGVDIQIRLAGRRANTDRAAAAEVAGPVGCGLCGIECIEQALKPVDSVGGHGSHWRR